MLLDFFQDGNICHSIQYEDQIHSLNLKPGEGVQFRTFFNENYKPPPGLKVVQLSADSPILGTKTARMMVVTLKKM